ncbi:MAG: sigma-70 family RNA polymerase sigma factor [Proteobacteria bacterium]|nr:sigma-70 family RNA polymerase sigma factor [Pseudomonadota bacterium]
MNDISEKNKLPKSESTAARGVELIAAIAKRGDKACFAELFGHYAPRVKSYLMRKGASPDIAEELAQEAMLTVWRKAGQFDPSKAAVSTWIFTVARNLSIDRFRKERRPEMDPDDPTLEPDTISADQSVENSQRQVIIQEALTTLPEEQSLIVRMAFFADKSHSEIAEELDIPLGTVKSRIRLALGRMRQQVGDVL